MGEGVYGVQWGLGCRGCITVVTHVREDMMGMDCNGGVLGVKWEVYGV